VDNKKKISLHDIKTEILKCLDEKGIEVKNIILFDSRSKEDYSEYSDYDFLIITKKTLPIKEKMKIAKAVRIALAELYIYSDIIINSEEEKEFKKNRIGYLTRYALKEGIKI